MTSGIAPAVGVDDRTAERLAAALRCITVSRDTGDRDDTEFRRLGEQLDRDYPLVHAELALERFGHSRLYRWDGAEPGQPAAILLAHLDVVPADDERLWTHPPFAGVVDDEFVWGRGAIDDKSRVLAVLEAVEALLAAGRRPRRTIYLAFGHDEELSGADGAARMATRLRELGVRADLLLDEGGVITTGLAAGVERPLGNIFIGEKGWATVKLTVVEPGGHSSMPGRDTAVSRIARAVARIQDHPMPLRMTPVVAEMLRRARPAMAEPRRSALRLLPVVSPVVTRILATRPQTEAMVRTTAAATVIHGGVKANVLPQRAEALVNFRILPGDSVAGVLEHCRRVVRDPEVRVELDGPVAEPSRIGAPGPAYDLVAEVACAVVPGIVPTIGIVPGATDSRHYDGLAGTRCNFAPIVLDEVDLGRIHGADERLSRTNYGRLIDFNHRLLDRLCTL